MPDPQTPMFETPAAPRGLAQAARVFAWTAATFAFAFAFAAPAAADWLELEARYWAPTLGGGGSATFEGVQVDLDLERDLGLDVDESLEGRLTIRPGAGFFLRGRFQNLSSAGTGTADLDVVLGTVDLGLRVATDGVLDFEYANLALGWQYESPQGKVRIGPFAEAKGVRGDASIRLSALGQSVQFADDFEGAFGAVGGLVEIQPTSRFQVFAEVSVLVEGDDADLTEAEAGLRFFATETLGLGVGYRSLQIDGTIDDIPLDLEFEGGFASLVLRF